MGIKTSELMIHNIFYGVIKKYLVNYWQNPMIFLNRLRSDLQSIYFNYIESLEKEPLVYKNETKVAVFKYVLNYYALLSYMRNSFLLKTY